MQQLLQELQLNPENKALIVMPIDRLVSETAFKAGEFFYFPQGELTLKDLNPVINHVLDKGDSFSDEIQAYNFEGQSLRELTSCLTGFDINVLNSHCLVAFITDMDWSLFSTQNHQADLQLIQKLSAAASKSLDVLRLNYCRFDLPDTLPGDAGSWNKSGSFLGAMIYSGVSTKSYLIGAEAVECSIVVKGLGLEVNPIDTINLPQPEQGEIAAIAQHALFLFSDALRAPNETTKFIRILTLLEFLSSPDEFKKWQKIKGDIACHYSKNNEEYLKVCSRFKHITAHEDHTGKQVGLRTLVIHQGKLIPDLLPDLPDRKALFRELQGYCHSVIDDMLKNKTMTWDDFCQLRAIKKRELGIS